MSRSTTAFSDDTVVSASSVDCRCSSRVEAPCSEDCTWPTALSAERRRGVRDKQLQHDLAQATGGALPDLTTTPLHRFEHLGYRVGERGVCLRAECDAACTDCTCGLADGDGSFRNV